MMRMSGGSIHASGLIAGYGERRVLNGIDWTVGARRTVVILGPGGSGKTTLLRLIQGEDAESRGLWWRGSLEVPDLPFYFLYQQPNRGAESLADVLGRCGSHQSWPYQWQERRCSELPIPIKKTPWSYPRDVLYGIWQCAPAAADTLRRVLEMPMAELPLNLLRLAKLTVAVATLSPYLLIDEPTAEMDDDGVAWVAQKLGELRGQRTIVLVTHHLALARAVADDVTLLIDGEILESGNAEPFFAAPRHPRARYFVRMGS